MHKFILNVSNVHTFTVQQNNYHQFLLTSSEATPVIALDFLDCSYFSTCYIGGREVPLNEFSLPLNGLPLTLRQFVGRYLYIIARGKGYLSSDFSLDMQDVIGVKMTSSIDFFNLSDMSVGGFVRGCGDVNSYQYNSNIDYGVAWRLYINNIGYSSTSNSQVDVGVRAKSSNGYNNTFVGSDSNLVVGRCKMSNINNVTTSVDDSKVSQYKCKMLSIYTDKLNTSPVTLKDFCYQAI